MVDRAVLALAGVVALCVTVAIGLIAAAMALYFALAPALGAAGAAGVVAGVAFAAFGALCLALVLQRERRAREAAAARSQLASLIPEDLGAFARERPLASLAATVLGGFVLARDPALARDLASLLAAWTRARD